MMFPLVSLIRSSSVHSKELSSMIASMRFGYLKHVPNFNLKFALMSHDERTNLGNVFEADGKRLDSVVVSPDSHVIDASHPSYVVDMFCGIQV